ncbi:MAG: thermonuclease family protein [Alphaproteobacteria bacterium]|nr:thermonuclease family protein [Alphaproteobacteria bacterium]
MFFLKKFLLGFGALFLILLGGAGTQTESTLLQGSGFLGLIIGLIVLYIFAKMAWRAMGCLPSIFLILAIIVFILYAIGGFSGGVMNIGNNLRNFLGQGNSSQHTVVANSSQSMAIPMLNSDNEDLSIGESFSEPLAESQPVNNTPQTENQGFNPQNYPAVYSAAQVVSADTLIIGGRYLRLFGIDAPENNQTCADRTGRSYACGQQAASWLKGWIADNELECRIVQQDQHGNMIGVCSLGAYDLGAALINAGWAVVYSEHSDIYMPYQVQAQQNARGLWQGEFYMPWDWRKIQTRKPKIKVINKPRSRKRTFFNPMGN